MSFIKMFAKKSKHLYVVLKEFNWIDECMAFFELIKIDCLAHMLVRRSPNWNKEFHVHKDAFAFEVRTILGRLGTD